MEREKILHLTLKKKWFDMIASGDKKEEYRERKGYWNTRLLTTETDELPNGNAVINIVPTQKFTHVEFRNGYAKYAPTLKIECKGIDIRTGNPEWGAIPETKYFVIKLGNIV